MFFISLQKLFSLLRYSNFRILQSQVFDDAIKMSKHETTNIVCILKWRRIIIAENVIIAENKTWNSHYNSMLVITLVTVKEINSVTIVMTGSSFYGIPAIPN